MIPLAVTQSTDVASNCFPKYNTIRWCSMRSSLLFAGILGVLLASLSAHAAPIDDILNRTTVLITSDNGSGTGVIVKSTENYAEVLTARHVITGAVTTRITIADGRVFEPTVVTCESIADLALLRITGHSLPRSIAFSAVPPANGELVYSAGWADTGRVTISSQRAIATMQLFQSTDSESRRGRSGGALTNERGELIGICSGTDAGKRTLYVNQTTIHRFLAGTLPTTDEATRHRYDDFIAYIWGMLLLICIITKYTPHTLHWFFRKPSGHPEQSMPIRITRSTYVRLQWRQR